MCQQSVIPMVRRWRVVNNTCLIADNRDRTIERLPIRIHKIVLELYFIKRADT